MIDAILKNDDLKAFLVDSCTENGISANLSDDIQNEDYIIIKPDDYYNSLNIDPTPASPDCIIIVRCVDGFKIVLVELKNIDSPSGFNKDHIREKFRTVVGDFMSNRFRDLFYNAHNIHLSMYFVSDPYRVLEGRNPHNSSLLQEIFITLRPLEFANKKCAIKAVTPNLTIEAC